MLFICWLVNGIFFSSSLPSGLRQLSEMKSIDMRNTFSSVFRPKDTSSPGCCFQSLSGDETAGWSPHTLSSAEARGRDGMNLSNQVPDPAVLRGRLPDRLGGTRGVRPRWRSEGHHGLGARGKSVGGCVRFMACLGGE